MMQDYEPEERPIRFETPAEILQSGRFVKICAPMVRYSRLPFRLLVRRWGCDIAYTPMLLAKEFACSSEARKGDFATSNYDRPLIVQFAARNAHELAIASQYVANDSDGIDINCGCPQKWAIGEGVGCALLKQPELIEDMIKQTKRISGLPVSIKIRIDHDLNNTVELARRAEHMGAQWITVHGRTVKDRSGTPVNYDAVRLVKDTVSIPVFGNGHCFTYSDALEWRERTGVDGVMAARGLLQNPALFANYDKTPPECVAEFIDIALQTGITSFLFRQHLIYMLSKVNTRTESRILKMLPSTASILEYYASHGLPIKSVDLADGVRRYIYEPRKV